MNTHTDEPEDTDTDLKIKFLWNLQEKNCERDARGKISYICSICIYTHTHIYIYTICVYRYMCTHIYICITTYKMLQYTFEKTMETKEREKGHGRIRRQGGCFFPAGFGGAAWTVAGTFADPDSLPPGSPLLYPLLPLQVLLPPICKISILYFLNRQGRETRRNGLRRATWGEGRRDAKKGNWKVLTGRCFRSHAISATFHPLLLTIMFLRPWFCSKGDIF